MGQFIAARWPVIQPLGGQCAPASSFQNISWTPLAANLFRAAYSIQTIGSSAVPAADGAGAQFIEISPGYITWFSGRNAWRLQIAYISGWPHTSLTANVTAGATTISVDDVTGWAGAIGQIYDGAETESITVESATANQTTTVFGNSVPSGPGTLTLTAGLEHAHQQDVLATALPYNIVWAAGLLCGSQALTRGATATVLPNMRQPGFSNPSSSASQVEKSVDTLYTEAKMILAPYVRTI